MDTVELKPTRRWPGEALAARFESVEQGPAFAAVTRGEWKPDERVPAVWLRSVGKVRGRLTVGDWLVQRTSAGSYFEVLSAAQYAEQFEPVGDEVVPLDRMVNTLPDPVDFRRRIMAAARSRYEHLVTEQGEVQDAADTFQPHRDLATTREVVKQYAATFRALDGELATFQRDQLERLPMATALVTVPDAAGDLTVQLDQYNVHTIDAAELQAAVSAVVLADGALDFIIDVVENASSVQEQREQLSGGVAAMLIAAQMHMVSLGKFEPQVTKVREFAKEQARTGADGLAAVIAGTIRTNRETRPGAKFTRKEPKP